MLEELVIACLLKPTGDAKLTAAWQKTLADLPTIPMTADELKRLPAGNHNAIRDRNAG